MVTLFVYDISNDRIRNKVSQICQDYGLSRIQYSAFLGDLTPNRQEELWLKCRRRLGKAAGNLQLFVLTPQDLARSRKYVSLSSGVDDAIEPSQAVQGGKAV
jgi:CRISPR-associated protein Cas2